MCGPMFRYDKLNVKLYIVITMTAPTVYSAYMIKICYDEVVVNQEMLVVGMVAEIFINKANNAWHAAQAIIYLVTIIVYCLLWIVVAKKGVGKTSKKLIKSLSLIMVTLVISWLFVGAFTAVHDSIVTETTPFDTYFYHINLGVFINIGVASNYFIYFIFKRLQHPCNVIIALTALTDILHQAAHVVFAYFYFSGNPYRSKTFCFQILATSAFNAFFGAFLVLSIGIDRLFCVLIPNQYNKVNLKLYWFVTLLPPTLYSIRLLLSCYEKVKEDRERPTIMMIAELFVGVSDVYRSQAVVYLAAIIVYSTLWITVSKKKIRTSSKTLIKSLSVIMMTLLIGWVFVGIFHSFYFKLHPVITPNEAFNLHMNMGWLINVGVAANYPIYFVFNNEYRTAFIGQLSILTCGQWKPGRRKITFLQMSSNTGF
ncbi:unnamed protein product [Bursaphelenchus okinawaensis]|uniref:G-protein coupled receptors family 1 profile domain-containing protein n=1 Tax=Bursaphelenchus okinawaensis TaxID=465554 RepID=A0A811L8C2_9BILA|nr:unnamed protein product [Bursaphelenchus okinawaensis]CAG9119228.1 unnamed protein product [Bursaphelenchus okinawaensis]